MSITSSKNLMCNKLVSEYDAIYIPLKRSADIIENEIDSLISDLDEMISSPANKIKEAADILSDKVSKMIPSLDTKSLDKIIDIINSCNFLKEDSILNNPSNAVKGSLYSTNIAIRNSISDLADTVPEFRVSDELSALKDKFSGEGTSKNMSKLDKILNCVSSICGAEYSSKISQMSDDISSLYGKFNMNSNPLSSSYGELNVTSILQNVSQDLKDNVNNSLDSIDGNKSTALTSIEKAANALKNII